MPDIRTSIGRVRLSGMAEGVSYLLLLGVAMPLKYFADMPMAVTWVGWLHGLLFMLYGLFVLLALIDGKLPFSKCVLAFFAALFPFGPFLIDGGLARLERER
jgi:integral membrane protein